MRMALSFKERNKIRKQIGQQTAQLEGAEGLTFKEKNRIRKEIGQLLAQLEAEIDKKPEVKNEKLTALIAGKYNTEKPERFLVILQEIVDEIQDIEPVKEPVIQYIEKYEEKKE
jgi:acetate kinase